MFQESLVFLPVRTAAETLLVDIAVFLLLLAAATVIARVRASRNRKIGRRLTIGRTASLMVVGVAAIGLRLALLPILPVPSPAVHDEFSYLLGSDTFAHFRLTNPTPAMAVHFESIHINVRPTYQSMYPPAQAMVLATGQVLFGSPWAGVLLSVAAMAMAVTWMLQAWMPARWALLGGLFCVLRFATFSYTVNSYMGGAAVAIGGALALGAVGRMRRRFRTREAVLLALGLGIMANSRPYEGFMFALPLLGYVGVLVWRARKDANVSYALRALAPGAALLVMIFLWMGYYNWRGTGDPLLMPYQANWQQYQITGPFIWQRPRAIPQYRDESLRKFYVQWQYEPAMGKRDFAGLVTASAEKLFAYYRFFVFPALPLFCIGMVHAWRQRRHRLLPIAIFWISFALLLEIWAPTPHYAAVAIAALVAVMLLGLRVVRTWRWRGVRVGVPFVQAFVVVIFALLVFKTSVRASQAHDKRYHFRLEFDRPELLRRIESEPGNHLVIVQYGPNHNPGEEWVYNGADIDTQRVVWARDKGAANSELVQYYAGRKVWVIRPD